MPCSLLWRCAALLICLVGANASFAAPPSFVFRDVSETSGVKGLIANMHGHAAAWGDADGDGQLDLYIGTFHKDGTAANRLLLQREGKFVDAGRKALEVSARSSGAVFADFDNDGDQDFYLSNLGGGKSGHSATDNKFFRNDGGTFVDISAESGACPGSFRGRSAAAVDFNGDGLLDLLVGESIQYGSAKRSRLLLNQGKLKFIDATEQVGLPALPALGVAVGDVNNDTWPDLLFVASDGGNRLFVSEKGQRVREAAEVSKLLQAPWKYTSGDDFTCGACLGDVNRDGRLDIVLGQHFERPWLAPVAVRLFLNRGGDKDPKFEDATETAGLKPLPMKSPHVELQDFDNDGWPDLYTSFVKFADGQPHPMIFKNAGASAGEVTFTEDTLGVNDYPTDDDRAVKGTGQFFTKMLKDGKVIYTAAAPTADYDRDGRVDIFLSSWWTETTGMLLKNETKVGNWLQVVVDNAAEGVNRQGIGAKVSIFAPGTTRPLLGSGEIAAGYGYSSGQEAVAHFGLGDLKTVDIHIQWPGEKTTLTKAGVSANQRITLRKE